MHFFPWIVYLENTETVDPNKRCITFRHHSTSFTIRMKCFWFLQWPSYALDNLGKEIFLSSKTPRPAMGPTHPFQWVPKVFSTGKAARVWGWTLTSCADIKNEWSYTSTSSVCLYGVYRDNVTFTKGLMVEQHFPSPKVYRLRFRLLIFWPLHFRVMSETVLWKYAVWI
jgi:hypothetical protein